MRIARHSCPLLVVALFASGTAAVEPGRPSKTSVWTATLRAIGAKNPDPEFRNPDSLAARFVGPRERALLSDYPVEAIDLDYADALKRIPDPPNVMGMFVRTKHVDASLEEALRDGARQVVVLGAGFDSRFFRFEDRLAGMTFIEVDYGPTQEYKKQRVKEIFGALPAHVRYVPMDFTRDDLLKQLRAGGYSERSKAFFIWEGVTRYIPESAVTATLRFVRDHAAPGSRIVFDYITTNNPMLNDPNTRTAKWGEPFVFGFPGAGAAAFVEREGLEVVSDLVGNEIVRKYAMRADGTSSLPVPRGRGAGAGGHLGGHCIARVPSR